MMAYMAWPFKNQNNFLHMLLKRLGFGFNRILNSLTQTLQSSGVDVSDTSISQTKVTENDLKNL